MRFRSWNVERVSHRRRRGTSCGNLNIPAAPVFCCDPGCSIRAHEDATRGFRAVGKSSRELKLKASGRATYGDPQNDLIPSGLKLVQRSNLCFEWKRSTRLQSERKVSERLSRPHYRFFAAENRDTAIELVHGMSSSGTSEMTGEAVSAPPSAPWRRPEAISASHAAAGCRLCQRPLPAPPARGRPRLTCSDRCRRRRDALTRQTLQVTPILKSRRMPGVAHASMVPAAWRQTLFCRGQTLIAETPRALTVSEFKLAWLQGVAALFSPFRAVTVFRASRG